MNKKNNENGLSLIAVIFITTFFTLLILALATQIDTGTKVNVVGTDQQKSFYLAESGIDYAIRRSKQNGEWDWKQNVSFANGTIKIQVDSILPDQSSINVIGLNGITAARNDLKIKHPNHHFYGLYIRGEADDNLYGDTGTFMSGQQTLPDMEDDSLTSISLKQGKDHYFGGDHEFNGYSADWKFYSNESHPENDAEVIYVDGDLSIKGSVSLEGILIVKGDLIVEKKSSLAMNGIVYFPGPNFSEVITSDKGGSDDDDGDDDDDHGHGHDDDHGHHGNDDKAGFDTGNNSNNGQGCNDEDDDDDDHGHGHDKVKICHNGKTIEVSENAVQAHLNHGDSLGKCNDDDDDDDDDDGSSGKNSYVNITGGIMGKVRIRNNNPKFQVTINRDKDFLVKFYTYGKIERISWQNEY